MRSSPTTAVLFAAVLAITGCGADKRPARAGGAATVQIVRVAFPARQHLGQAAPFAITVRNAGDTTIASVAVTLAGLTRRDADGTQRPLWIVDQAPPGVVAATDDTSAAGPVKPGAQITLRWLLTPTVAGTHAVGWAVAAGDAPALLAGGATPRGTRTVRVSAKPAVARVDPRTGRVVRE